MTLDELRDAHAKRKMLADLTEPHTMEWAEREWDNEFFRRADLNGWHPIPATLDAIAGLMPPDWDWQRNHVDWIAGKRGGAQRTLWRMASTPDTGDELTDRARLAWLAWEAEAKGAAQ
jgi:hypothetical protein